MAGGMGRKGAQKVIIFETDGLPNTSATASLVNAGSVHYYQIRYDMNNPVRSEYPSVNATYHQRLHGAEPDLLARPAASDHLRHAAQPVPAVRHRLRAGLPGTERQRRPSRPCRTMQYYAGTQSSASTALPSNQIITGTDSQMSANMIPPSRRSCKAVCRSL